MEKLKKQLEQLLLPIYSDECSNLVPRLIDLAQAFKTKRTEKSQETSHGLDARDMMLITYGDTICNTNIEQEMPLHTLHQFLIKHVGNRLSSVHLLPFYPYTSDDGFSVVDYWKVNPGVGQWQDVRELATNYDLMFDGVVNHISSQSEWFKGYLDGKEEYLGFFTEANPENPELNKVTRPRALPLLTAFDVKDSKGHIGTRHIWTTFSDDQVDLNFASPEVFARISELILFYVSQGARYLRLDAIGFIWKELGTSCIHLPKAHSLIKTWRAICDEVAPEVRLITETNVPHKENISYFGNGDEAHLVYQFPLPPLTLHAFLTEDATHLTSWVKGLESCQPGTTFFNFLASHDGIGMRPIEGLLPTDAKQFMVEKCLEHGGRVSFKDNGDGSKSPYELNINYQDALTPLEASDLERTDRFLAAQSILLSLAGLPGIYIHSLLGSRNDYCGLEESGINRRINREKLDITQLEMELSEGGVRHQLFQRYLERLEVRGAQPAFSPNAPQQVLELNPQVLTLLRGEGKEQILVLVNVSNKLVELDLPYSGQDLLSGEYLQGQFQVQPLQVCWIKTSEYQ
ncbi:sugar phosphorylase [Vibrio cholerae]